MRFCQNLYSLRQPESAVFNLVCEFLYFRGLAPGAATSLSNKQLITFVTNIQTHLDVVLLEVGDDLCLVFIEDLEQDGPSLAVLLQQEQAAVPVLRGGGGTAVLRHRTLIWNTATHTHTE